MGLCSYFLQNKCTFGTNCKNEHINVKQLVQTDLDSAVKGKQWPLSCYGPFRDKPSVPNFITDQSFEEIRALCYESKNQGNFQSVAAQINQQIIDAKARISILHEFNGDAQSIIVNLRGIGDDIVDTGQTTNNFNTSNPFSINAPSVASVNQTSTNLFGTSTTNSSANVFASNNGTNKGFGGTTSGGLFNSTTSFSNANSGGSIFGGSSVGFGLTTAVGAFQTTASVTPFSQIGKPTESQQTGTGNIFGIGQQQNAQATFGGPASFGNKTSNIFGQQQQTTTTSSIFGQNQQAFGVDTTQQQSSIFGNTTSANQNVFGGGGIVSDTTNISNQPSIFGGTTTTVVGNMFGNQQPALLPAQNAFGVQTQPSTFGNNVGSTIPISSQHTTNSSSIFNNQTTNQPESNSFGTFGFQNEAFQPQQQPSVFTAVGTTTTQSSQPSFFGDTKTTNIFQTQEQMAAQSITNTSVTSTASTINSTTTTTAAASNVESKIYSKIENLTQEQLECFKANAFVLGKIPTVPPPRELCT